MSGNETKIRKVCDELGIKVNSLQWQPVGIVMEMMGREGGWILNGFNQIGLSTKQAVANLQEHPDWYKTEDDEEEEGAEEDDEPKVFTNCNVCGRKLMSHDEDEMGMCEPCSFE